MSKFGLEQQRSTKHVMRGALFATGLLLTGCTFGDNNSESATTSAMEVIDRPTEQDKIERVMRTEHDPQARLDLLVRIGCSELAFYEDINIGGGPVPMHDSLDRYKAARFTYDQMQQNVPFEQYAMTFDEQAKIACPDVVN